MGVGVNCPDPSKTVNFKNYTHDQSDIYLKTGNLIPNKDLEEFN